MIRRKRPKYRRNRAILRRYATASEWSFDMFNRRSSTRNSLLCGLFALVTFIGIGVLASA